MGWYKSSTPVLGGSTTKDRRDLLEEMRRLLLAIIPRERGRSMKEKDFVHYCGLPRLTFILGPHLVVDRQMAVSPESAKS